MYRIHNNTHNNNGLGGGFMNTLQKVCLVITIIGALNWGFIGLLDINLITSIFGAESMICRIIYSLVGLTGLINVGILFTHLDED